jgi:hypothetical protein
VDSFGRLGKFERDPSIIQNQRLEGEGVKVPSLYSNPAKYMKRFDNNELLNHPMNRLANWNKPDYQTLISLE